MQSSNRVQSCDSTSVRWTSGCSGMGIELRSIRACIKETERDMTRVCGLPRAKDRRIEVQDKHDVFVLIYNISLGAFSSDVRTMRRFSMRRFTAL